MRARTFFDANVLVDADDQDAPAKQRRALDLIAEHRRARTGVVSLQVLQEYFVTVTANCTLTHASPVGKSN
jgi:predicted nucleic acid-binding protein